MRIISTKFKKQLFPNLVHSTMPFQADLIWFDSTLKRTFVQNVTMSYIVDLKSRASFWAFLRKSAPSGTLIWNLRRFSLHLNFCRIIQRSCESVLSERGLFQLKLNLKVFKLKPSTFNNVRVYLFILYMSY
jgi:hypothetical protein